MSIPFTQYLMPNGRTAHVEISMPYDVEERAREFIDAGGWFEVEMLPDYDTVSLTACFDVGDGDDDIAIRVVRNGPPVVRAVRELVEEAYAKLPRLVYGH